MVPIVEKPKTKRVIAIQCSLCFYWNIPKITKNDKIVYPKACKNRNCRTTSYMKPRSQVLAEKQERGKNLWRIGLSNRKKKVTVSQVYNRTA